MKILIKNGHVIDPSQNISEKLDVLIDAGKIIDLIKPSATFSVPAEIIDARNLIVSPGFVDLHSHLRDPGFEYKETIRTGSASAVAGGFTSVCCMANTDPINDNASVTDYILKQTRETGFCKVYPIGAITKGLKGEELAPIGELKDAGCIAISDDGLTVQDARLMRLALAYAKSLGLPVTTHSIEANLARGGSMNESIISTRLGLTGSPNAAEDIIIARDIMLTELTGGHLHVGHLSTEGGIRLVADAKRRGLNVTCEVTPHHFTLTDESVGDYDTNAKMCPPLRSQKDVDAIRNAFKLGVIDAIATDHAPHGVIDKEIEFDKAAFGIIGFETALPLSLALVRDQFITLEEMIKLLSTRPAEVFQLPAGTLKKGVSADLTIFDPAKKWVFSKDKIISKSKNSPFIDRELQGAVRMTIVSGEIKYDMQRGVIGF